MTARPRPCSRAWAAPASIAAARGGFEAVADPGAQLYDAFGVTASLAGYLHPRSLLAFGRATIAGKLHGRFEGRETQMPADVVLDATGGIVLAHQGRDVGGHAPVAALLAAVDSVTGR